MSKKGEMNYFRAIGPEGVEHSLRKPFSDANCGRYLCHIGAIMQLLPPVPARLLDAGCGTGWTSFFLARRGYAVLGVDISPSAIAHAKEMKKKEGLDHLDFAVQDYEEMVFCNEFDGVLFYDSLHHSENEKRAIASAYRALKPGGLCITSEPGEGHSAQEASRHAVNTYDVSERDMPARLIAAAGREAGFTSIACWPMMLDGAPIVGQSTTPWVRRLARWRVFSEALTVFRILRLLMRQYRSDQGLVVMTK